MIFLITILAVIVVLFLLHTLFNMEYYPMDEEARKEASGAFVNLSHGATHYHIYGSENKETVVLIYGISLPSYSWNDFATQLANNGLKVITYDLYGRGYSERPYTIYNGRLYIRQLQELLDALHVTEKVSILGISMGGGIANHFASHHPERVKKIVLLTPLHTSNILATLFTTPPLGELMLTILAARKMIAIQNETAKELDLPAGWSAPYRRQMEFFGYRRAIISSIREFATENHVESFKKIAALKMPVLLIWGKDDKVIPFSGHKSVMANIPHAQFLPLDNTGHLIHLEELEIVTKNVVEFLRD